MASDTTPRQPISPEKRRIYQMCFERGSKAAAQGQFDYATDMFMQCILGDPGNRIYVSNFLGNLQKTYNNNKQGAKLAGMRTATTKGVIKKAEMQKDWLSVLKNGAEVLKLNPWDSGTLLQMARACDPMNCPETQLAWLRAAHEVHPDDLEINRECAIALGRQGQFDQAIVYWARIEKARPNDEEALRAISDMQVKKTEAQLVRRKERARHAAADEAAKLAGDPASGRLTRQQELQQAITENPANIDAYIELAELHARDDRLTEAERILRGALGASGGDLRVREAYEDMGFSPAQMQEIRRYRRETAASNDYAPFRKYFRRDMHASMVANLARLGLLTDRVRPRLERLGITLPAR